MSATVDKALNALAAAAGVSRNSVVEQLVLDAWHAVKESVGSKYPFASTVTLANMVEWFNADANAFAGMSDDEFFSALSSQTGMLGEIIGRGIPFNKDQANALGGRYLGSLDDGSIVSRDAELKFSPGRYGRELCVLRPDGSKVRFEVADFGDEWATDSIYED